MNHNMNMVTTINVVITVASIALVHDLNTLYKNALAKKIILVTGNTIISPGGYRVS